MQVGLLDVDITGPSIPRMLGLTGKSVMQCTDGWVPVYADADKNLAVMSIGIFAFTSNTILPLALTSACLDETEATYRHRQPPTHRLAHSFAVLCARARSLAGFLTADDADPVVWRGPKKTGREQ